MKKKTKMLMVLFLVFTLLGIWNNIAISQEDMMVTPIMGFPEATITIFPIVLNMTGPVGKNSQYREFTDRYMHAFRERVNSETLGRLLEEKGYDKFEVSDAKFQFPMDSTEREKRAAIFGKFVREVELKTDYALGIEFTLHIENSWQEVYWVITDEYGNIAREDRQGPGDRAFDEDYAGSELGRLELICSRLVPAMGLTKLPEKELAEDKMLALQEMRSKEPPGKSEFAAMDERLKTMKKTGVSARVLVFPTRVGGDNIDYPSAMRLSELINDANLCQATVAENDPVLEGKGWPNEAAVLWLFANTVKEYIHQNPPNSDYVLFADYWFAPNGQVWAVHFVVCDRSGAWVIVDMQNNHHEDFQRINPKTMEDCDHLVLERLKKRLR